MQNTKLIICFETGKIFKDAKECEDIGLEIFGMELKFNGVVQVCCGKRKSYKGFTFKYVSDLTEEQIKEIQENAKLNQVI